MITPANFTGRMLVVCSWCKPARHFGEKPCAPELDGRTSHSICPACAAVALGELPGGLREIAPEVARPREGRAA